MIDDEGRSGNWRVKRSFLAPFGNNILDESPRQDYPLGYANITRNTGPNCRGLSQEVARCDVSVLPQPRMDGRWLRFHIVFRQSTGHQHRRSGITLRHFDVYDLRQHAFSQSNNNRNARSSGRGAVTNARPFKRTAILASDNWRLYCPASNAPQL